jgi:HAD superfamily hydrolase (TIGR01509 family)
MTPPAACLFDLDGLLLDTEPLHARAWQEAAAHFGTNLGPTQLRQLRGRRRHDCAEQVLRWIEADGGRCDGPGALLAVRQPIAEQLLPLARPLPGAEQLVRRCHDLGVPMALATSSAKAAVERKAAPHPWLALISTRVHGDDPALGAGKPAPDVFLVAAERLRVDPRRCWAFEDSPAGAQAASAAGCLVHVLRSEEAGVEGFPAGALWIDSLHEVRIGKGEHGHEAPDLRSTQKRADQ